MIAWKPYDFIQAAFAGRLQIQPQCLELERLITIKQVHGAHIVELKDAQDLEDAPSREGDAIISSLAEFPIAIRTADCVPILISSSEGIIAAVHAGWKGTLLEILRKTLMRMQEKFLVDLQKTQVAIGPAICKQCFEIGEEVASQFIEKSGDKFLTSGLPGKYFLDLKSLNAEQALLSGVPEANIRLEAACTLCHEDRFFSYRGAQRRKENNQGRNYSWILRKM